jgi:hypothetical protein
MIAYNTNPNTLNYDLQYQRMDVSLNPSVYMISGSVTSHFKPNQSMSNIYFDLSNALTVSQVTYHNQSLTFQQLTTKELKIDFPTALPANVLILLPFNIPELHQRRTTLFRRDLRADHRFFLL